MFMAVKFPGSSGLSRLISLIKAALAGKQNKHTGTAGKLVGFNNAGDANPLTVSGGDITASQSGTNLALALKASGVTAGTFGPQTSQGCVWTSNNGGVNSSTAQTTLTAKQACTVSFDYSYSSEANYDKMTVTVGGTTVANGLSGATTNKSYSGSLASGAAIVFKYAKDGSQNTNDDRCTFSNFTVKVGNGPAVLLNSQNIGTYFNVTDGAYRFVPEDYCDSSLVTFPETAVDAKGRVTQVSEKEISLGAVVHPHGACTIPTSGWSSDSTAGFPCYYDLAVRGVTADDRADVLIPAAGASAAAACGLCPATETLAGKIRLRAASAPTSAISAMYWISKA